MWVRRPPDFWARSPYSPERNVDRGIEVFALQYKERYAPVGLNQNFLLFAVAFLAELIKATLDLLIIFALHEERDTSCADMTSYIVTPKVHSHTQSVTLSAGPAGTTACSKKLRPLNVTHEKLKPEARAYPALGLPALLTHVP